MFSSVSLICVAFLIAQITIGCETDSVSQVKCVKNAYPPEQDTALPWYELNLDLPPEQRWIDILVDNAQGIRDVIDVLTNILSSLPHGAQIIEFLDETLPVLFDSLPQPYQAEIKTVAAVTNIPLGQAIIYNIFYEVFSVCTSIVAQDENGHKIHGRNLDFGLFLGWDMRNHTWVLSEKLRNIVMNVNVTRGGKSLYKAASFAGYLGVFTGVKENTFSVSLNERFTEEGGFVGLFDWIIKGDHNQSWSTWLIRDLLEGESTYQDAIHYMSTNKMVASGYFIVAGAAEGEGILITRSRTENLQPLTLDSDHGRWYLLETNYDHWKAPLFIDDRRTPGMKCMNESSPATIDKAAIYNVLSTDPVLNKLTVYTALMDPVTGELESYRRSCPDCSPW